MYPVQLLQRAAAAYAQRDLGAAERDCRSILQVQPGDPEATHLLGLVRRLAGDPLEAERLLRASIERAPRRAEFRVNLGNLLRSTNKLRDAEEQYRAALEIEPDSRAARLALVGVLRDGGATAGSEAEARRLVERDPQDAQAWMALGVAQRALGRLEDAESSYRRALDVRPDYAAAHHNLGALLGQLKQAEASLAQLDRAAALGISGWELHFNRGRALMELGRFDEADAALASAVGVAPENVESQVLLSKLRFMRGDPDYTRALAAAAAGSGDAGLVLALGDLLRRGDRLEEAERTVRGLIAARGWLPQAGAALAVLQQEQGRLEEAVVEARRAQAALPDDPNAAENLIAILLQRGEAEEPWPLILRERKRSPLDQRWLAYEATAARLAGKPQYGELYDYQRFVRAFDLEPPAGYADIRAFNSALSERLVDRHRLATHPLDQSLRLGTQTARSLLADPDPVIQAFIRALDRPVEAYREALGHDPGHPFLERNRGPSRLVGCWSVRLARGGYHVNHVHPEGWISSAYYVEVPPEVDDVNQQSGWIKFGEPRMPSPATPPAHFVQPRAGRLVLFPSYMWHGTMPIHGDAPRMTIAFDAVPGDG
jgi:Flp pilus assembly protein TadD